MASRRTTRRVSAATPKDFAPAAAKIFRRLASADKQSMRRPTAALRLELSASQAHARQRREPNRRLQIPSAREEASSARPGRRTAPWFDHQKIAVRKIAGPAEWQTIQNERISRGAVATEVEREHRWINFPILRPAGRRLSDSSPTRHPILTRLFPLVVPRGWPCHHRRDARGRPGVESIQGHIAPEEASEKMVSRFREDIRRNKRRARNRVRSTPLIERRPRHFHSPRRLQRTFPLRPSRSPRQAR